MNVVETTVVMIANKFNTFYICSVYIFEKMEAFLVTWKK